MSPLKVKSIEFDSAGLPQATFHQDNQYGSSKPVITLNFEELEETIHRMMLVRHMLQVHKDHDKCPECLLQAISKQEVP
jgi:hypothetical protein